MPDLKGGLSVVSKYEMSGLFSNLNHLRYKCEGELNAVNIIFCIFLVSQ